LPPDSGSEIERPQCIKRNVTTGRWCEWGPHKAVPRLSCLGDELDDRNVEIAILIRTLDARTTRAHILICRGMAFSAALSKGSDPLDQDQRQPANTLLYGPQCPKPTFRLINASHIHCARGLRPAGRNDRQERHPAVGISLPETSLELAQCLGGRAGFNSPDILARLAGRLAFPVRTTSISHY
jgi:hypothetical protein